MKNGERPRSLRLLIVQANPMSLTRLRLDAEQREIERRVRASPLRDRMEVRSSPATRLSDVSTEILWHRPDILHFSGHGTEHNGLVFEDEAGRAVAAEVSALRRLIASVGSSVSVAVLNACWSDAQANELSRILPCTIGMSAEIDDQAAILFSGVFYEVLSYGKSVQSAFDAAAAATDLQGSSTGLMSSVAKLRLAPGTDLSVLLATSESCPPEEPVPSSKQSKPLVLSGLENAALRESSRKRTAFPTDLSFDELIEKELYVPPVVRGGEAIRIDLQVVEWLAAGDSVLLLGDPGSGKSLLSYSVMRTAAALGRFGTLLIDAADGYPTGWVPLAPSGTSSWVDACAFVEASGASNSVAIIDALDEAVASGSKVSSIGERVRKWISVLPALVVCRRFEYEMLLSAGVGSELFSHVVVLEDWRIEYEFEDYLRRINAAGYGSQAAAVKSALASNASLYSLCARPLYARMLTYVASDAQELMSSGLSSLYSTYIGKLLRSSELRWKVAAREGSVRLEVSNFCGSCFEERLMRGSSVPMQLAVSSVWGRGDDAITRALGLLFDVVDAGRNAWLRPIHFSFYEYLVAEDSFNRILESVDNRDYSGHRLPRRELTQAIRHFLRDQVQSWHRAPISDWIERTFDELSRVADRSSDMVVAKNLLIYVAGRLQPPMLKFLEKVASTETDDYILNSSYSAMCEGMNFRGAHLYLDALNQSSDLRVINRGWHLYYYHDLGEEAEPPYKDSSSATWDRTFERLMLLAEGYARLEQVEARSALYAHTLLDFCIEKEISLPQEGVMAISKIVSLLSRHSKWCSDILAEKLADYLRSVESS
jgi:CHAT domain